MKPQNFFNTGKITIISIAVILFAILFYFITSFYFFPKEIKILAEIENHLDFRVPINATIDADSVAVLNINSESVKENIEVSLASPFSIEIPEQSSLKMTLNLFGFPIKTVKVESLPYSEVVPSGMTVGVRINTEGVMVLGTGFVHALEGGEVQPSKDLLKSGDLILEANGTVLKDKKMLMDIIESTDDEIRMKVKRDDEIIDINISAVESTDGKKKIGVWIRDSTQGIGTITYYEPNTGNFAALGHGILDVDTKTLMSVRTGTIMPSSIESVKKSKKGSPGELEGRIEGNNVLGTIQSNTPYGIYGQMDESFIESSENKTRKIALQGEVREGPATILSNVKGKEVESYNVYIETINRYSSDDSKGMVVRILDPRLLEETNGIVQGMSGSPIIQNEKLVGAITHVFIQEPSKGYGIFIENMLKQSQEDSA